MSDSTRLKALESIHGILTTSEDLVTMLKNTAEHTGPEGQTLVEYITVVVETQAKLIRILTEGQLELSDSIDQIVKTYMQ